MSDDNKYIIDKLKEMRENFGNLSDESKKYLMFSYCLHAENTQACKEIIESFDKGKVTNYSKQIVLGQLSKHMNSFNMSLESFFHDSKINYLNILKKFKVLVDELDLKNSLEISILFTYLMWNGYFSKDKVFNYQMEKRGLIPGMYSYDIMNGNGVCLNFSDMLRDILIECGYNSSILTNKAKSSKDCKNSYVPEIKRNVIKSNNLMTKIMPILLAPVINGIGNHAFNLIEENGKLYIYDVTNLLFLEIEDTLSANILVGKGDFKLTPYFSYVLNNPNERIALDKLHMMDNFESPFTKREYIITYENCIDLFNKNRDIFDDYHSDIKNDILRIVDDLNYYKDNKKKIL